MPLRKNYPQDYVDQCKLRVKQQLGTCRDLIAAPTPHKTKDAKINAAVESFEPVSLSWVTRTS